MLARFVDSGRPMVAPTIDLTLLNIFYHKIMEKSRILSVFVEILQNKVIVL